MKGIIALGLFSFSIIIKASPIIVTPEYINIGVGNIGDGNIGNYNQGNNNFGDLNIGNDNVGWNNQGNGNEGYDNIGDFNQGWNNRGDNNVGWDNIGNNNIGYNNIGNDNQGWDNIGNANIGVGNIGNANIGFYNIGSENKGIGNLGFKNNGLYNQGINNKGNFNQGNNNDGDFNKGNNHKGNNNKDEKILETDIAPIFFLNIDFQTKIASLGDSDSNKLESGVVTTIKKPTAKVIKRVKKGSFGVGLIKYWHYPNAGDVYKDLQYRSFGVGLIPNINSNKIYTKIINHNEKVEDIVYDNPYKASNVIKWRPGESLQYKSDGGLLLSAYATQVPLLTGASVVIKGIHEIQISKLTSTIVNVELKTSYFMGADVSVGLYLGAMRANKDWILGTKHSFNIDLSDKYAAMAYEDFVKGNMKPLQQMAATPNNPFVAYLGKTKNSLTGGSKSLTLSTPIVPVLSFDFTKSHYHNKTFFYKDGKKKDYKTNVGIFYKGIKTRAFSEHHSNYKTFASAIVSSIVETKENKSTKIETMESQFTWNDEKSNSSSVELNKTIKQLNMSAGLDNLFKVRMQEENSDLGYTHVQAKINYPNEYMLHLLALYNNGKLETVKSNALKLVQSFVQGPNAFDLCQVGTVKRPGRKGRYRQTKREAIESCKNGLTNEIRWNFWRIGHHFDDIVNQLKMNNTKKSSKLFSEVGERIWKNRFLMQAFINEGVHCGVSAVISITGEKLNPYRLKAQYPYDAKKCYSKNW